MRKKIKKCPNCKIKLLFCMEGEFLYCSKCDYQEDAFRVVNKIKRLIAEYDS